MVDLSSKVDFAGKRDIKICSSEDGLRQDVIFVGQQLLSRFVKLEPAAKSLVLRSDCSEFFLEFGDCCLLDVFEVV